jgi:ribosomal protein S18 acetylase RimI-like enzyme
MAEAVRLVRDLTGPLAAPRWPAGIRLAPLGATLAPRAHALLRAAYAQGFGSVPQNFDTWWPPTRHDPEFDAALCFCAVAEETLVGFALCWTSGFVKDIAVAPPQRRRGIGAALLDAAATTFQQRGLTRLALKVHADNVGARRLYARLGFRDG